MLERIFKRRDVLEFVDEVISSSNYHNKVSSYYDRYEKFYDSSCALFLFFDALYKYQIIINDDSYLNDYIMQVRKLLKKLDDVNDIRDGINKVIGKICALKLGLSDREDDLAKEYIIKYIYDKYVVNGYVFHGLPSVYKDQILKYGMIPEQYHNTYDKFIEIDKIFSKNEMENIMNKSFNEDYVCFTDDFTLGCFYAFASPMYFYKLVGDSGINSKNYDCLAYFKNDYFGCFNNLNLLMRKAKLSDSQKKIVMRSCFEEWRLLKTDISTVSIMMIKRSLVGVDNLKEIDEIISKSSSCDLGISIGKLFNSCNNKIEVRQKINPSDIKFININNYKAIMAYKKKMLEDVRNRQSSYNSDKIVNAYGKASILMLMGSLLITLGVIITIIMISKG